MNINVQMNPGFKEVDRSKEKIYRYERLCWIRKEC